MRYLCMIHHEQAAFDRMTPEELQAMQREAIAFDKQLAAAGRLVIATPLKLPREARQIRVRGRKPTVTDGPFAETKEQLIGFLLIEADSMEHAVAIMSEEPLARTGIVEIRELSFHGDPATRTGQAPEACRLEDEERLQPRHAIDHTEANATQRAARRKRSRTSG